MENISNTEIKRLFIASMKRAYDFTYEDNNPFIISLSNEKFFVMLKSVSSACFKKSPDVTRVQLHYNNSFKKVIAAKIPFIILGYDSENDVFVSWNPEEIKNRLNAKKIVSLYSRKSLQNNTKGKNFKEGVLSNGAKIILFKKNLLVDFFRDWKNLYDFEIENIIPPKTSKVDISPLVSGKIYEITDKDVIKTITPLLKGSRVLEAATVCYDHYSSKYKAMKIKDWLNIVNEMYTKMHQ